ncbi:MAG: hypothetical protein DRG78_04500 [Epsilonproteobacteria bacterium]|nr:MAG: hypothetical protein DRG78_04500 [Campylobacterota bacterium]
MSEIITEEINKAIDANMPAAVASQYKKFIEEAERTIIKLKTAEEKILIVESNKKDLIKERDKLKEELEYYKKLKLDESVIIERELKLSKTILENKLENAEQRNTDVLRLVDKVFGHPSVTVSTTSNKTLSVESGGDACGYTIPVVDSETSTTTESKT